LDAIAQVVDPHTSYFSPNEQEDFVEELSKDNRAFGIQFDESDKGGVIIYEVLPGSPAWVSGELNKGDEVLSLKLGDHEKLDLTTAGIEELNLMFAAFNDDELTLIIRKANGQTKEVVIEQGLVYDDQDVIKSVLLDGEKKIGYITLPDFYTNWNGMAGNGCANDVAKSIVKLKKEAIDGLILDLRNNGGGSVREAIDLAGMFINYGPLAITQEQSREPNSMKDFNKGSIYSGPLVILVNGLSASASEIFTAAMQDHNRAIIVGSTTYGKATGQIMLPLDPNILNPYNTEPIDESLGYLKVTTSKYYHITKSTHQKEGLRPDIELPDVYDIYDYRESAYENALIKDSVVKKVYYTAASEFPIQELQQASQNRLAASSFGNALMHTIDSLKTVMNGPEKFELNIEKYQDQSRNLSQTIDSLFSYLEQSTDAFVVKNNQYDLRIMEMNAYRSELNDAYLKRLTEDIYLDEAYRVLVDYISLGK
jgi:carboxyl-terminal processing protease